MAKKRAPRKEAGDKAPLPASSRQQQLRVPAHGGGKLRVGNPGNKGGGRPRSVVKAAFLHSLDQRLPILEHIADGAVPQQVDGETVMLPVRVEDRIKAISAIGRVGMQVDPDELNRQPGGGPTFVFVVPGAVTPDEWLQRYAQQQRQLPPGGRDALGS